MGQSSDQIRQEIDQTRGNAADKIDQLQHQVENTSTQIRDQVQGTTEQVQETVQQVREQVQGTVEDTLHSAQKAVENVDLQKQVQERPLIAVGAAFIGGILLGKMTSGGNGHSGGHASYPRFQPGESGAYEQPPSSGGMSDGLRSAIHKSGLEDTISNAAAAMMGTVTDQLKSTLNQNFPGFTDKLQSAQKTEGSIIDKSKAAVDPETQPTASPVL
jgi:ElaB/YqjD/DUF883 family membrane-anchored ribosome-binding protein